MHLNKSDGDHDAKVSQSKSSSSASLRRALGKTSGTGSSGSSSVWDWELPPPCSKCSALNDRLLGEATKVNGLMRRIQEHQEEVGDPKERRIPKHRRGCGGGCFEGGRYENTSNERGSVFQKYI